MVKHERSESPEPSGNSPSPSPSPSPPPPKKSRGNKGAAKAKGPTKAVTKPKSWDTAQTITLLEAVFDAASKTIDKNALATQLGVSKQSVGDQLVKNRNNLRKLAIDLVRAKKGGA
ncbi:hypothetical protein CspHIS471_0409130 [Cutaneotrichosporon sp. HIS471]|nr:hypothetical protein CspHIS471_0409130 [Cutaneotrichosporon sp. HIS471]